MISDITGIFKERPKNQTAQLIIRLLIVLLFLDCFLGYILPLNIFPYLLIPLVIANIVFLFLNKTKKKLLSILMNLSMLNISILLFFPILGYFPAVIFGLPLATLQLIFFALNYIKDTVESEEVVEKKK